MLAAVGPGRAPGLQKRGGRPRTLPPFPPPAASGSPDPGCLCHPQWALRFPTPSPHGGLWPRAHEQRFPSSPPAGEGRGVHGPKLQPVKGGGWRGNERSKGGRWPSPPLHPYHASEPKAATSAQRPPATQMLRQTRHTTESSNCQPVKHAFALCHTQRKSPLPHGSGLDDRSVLVRFQAFGRTSIHDVTGLLMLCPHARLSTLHPGALLQLLLTPCR